MHRDRALNGYCAGAPGVRCGAVIRRYGDDAATLCLDCQIALQVWRRQVRAERALGQAA